MNPLLEAARKKTKQRIDPQFTREHYELVIAALRGEVSLCAASKVLSGDRPNMHMVWKVLVAGVASGDIEVRITEKRGSQTATLSQGFAKAAAAAGCRRG